ncbi:hypothetical protein, partial [Pseudomonas syringae]|uniref:hypothetical protein n=1 Tax=Pseudomonas syringae TaxID=317 RepID=UPI001FEF2D26
NHFATRPQTKDASLEHQTHFDFAENLYFFGFQPIESKGFFSIPRSGMDAILYWFACHVKNEEKIIRRRCIAAIATAPDAPEAYRV